MNSYGNDDKIINIECRARPLHSENNEDSSSIYSKNKKLGGKVKLTQSTTSILPKWTR